MEVGGGGCSGISGDGSSGEYTKDFSVCTADASVVYERICVIPGNHIA